MNSKTQKVSSPLLSGYLQSLIWGQRWRVRRRNDGPEELVITTEPSEEEDNPLGIDDGSFITHFVHLKVDIID